MIKVGLVGFGFAAQTFHLPLLRVCDEFEIVAVSSRYPESVNAQLPNARVYDDYRLLLTDREVDLVVITAPNHLHFAIAKDALEHQKHVVLEKPMTTSAEDGTALVDLATAMERKLTVFHNRRWDGDFLTIQKVIESGDLGEVKVFESHFDRFRPNVRQRWREQPGDGTGIWYDLGPHLADQAIQLFGLPNSVTAKCLALRDGSEVCDYFHVQLHYDHCEVILNSSPFSAQPNKRFDIQGTKGAFVVSGLDAQEQHLKEGVCATSNTFGVSKGVQTAAYYNDSDKKVVEIGRGEYLSFYQQLAHAIVNNAPVPVEPLEIVDVIRLIQLAKKSSDEGCTLYWTS